jgi:hypothetical protein
MGWAIGEQPDDVAIKPSLSTRGAATVVKALTSGVGKTKKRE